MDSSTTAPDLTCHRDPRTADALGEAGGELAARLSGEFGAPVGVFDPLLNLWVGRTGAPAGKFPRLTVGPAAKLLANGRAGLGRGGEPGDVVWLFVPVRAAETPLVAAAGFAAAPPGAGERSRWGPFCPEPALRAWGQAVADRYRLRSAERPAAPTPPAARPGAAPGGGGAGRAVVNRLIRRLQISDPPERFQQLAANALRAAMGVKAVAWVPSAPGEPVVVSGAVGRLKGDDFRALVPAAAGETALVVNAFDPAGDPAPREYVAAASDPRATAGWLLAFDRLDGTPFGPGDGEPLAPVASLIAAHQSNARAYADLKDLLYGVIGSLTSAVDAKDPYTSGHSERVARIAVRLGAQLGMNVNQRGDLYLMGLLHDVGKIGIDDAVLKKAGPLTPDEYHQIQAHVGIGVHILSGLKKLSHLLPGVRHHHESVDGSGYPGGLSGEQIPIEARILAVADSFDAMSSTRPYRRRLTPAQVDEILRRGAGVQWDREVIEALFACRVDLDRVRQKGLGESLHLAVNETLGRP